MTNTQRNEEMWNRLGAERERESEGGWRERKRTKKSERNENGNIQNKVFSSPSILSNYTVKSIFGKLATVWLGVRVHFVGYARN